MPHLWLLARVCEEGLATSLLDAAAQPAGPCLDAMTMRSYANAFRDFNDPNLRKVELPDSRAMRLVKLNQFRRQFGREPVIDDE